MAGQPYLQPMQGYQGGFVVTRPFPEPPPQYYAPPRSGIPWPIKLGLGVGVPVLVYFIVGKVLQSQGINAGCPQGDVGLPLLCVPGTSGGTPPPPPSGGGVPAYATFDSSNPAITVYVCQASENSSLGQGCGCCGTPAVCRGAVTVTGTVYDKNGAPVPNQLVQVAAQGPTALQPAGFDVPSQVQTDANGKFSMNVTANSYANPGTSCCGPEYSQDGPYPQGQLVLGAPLAIPALLPISVLYKRYQPNLTGSCPGDCQQTQWQDCTVSF